MLKNKGDNKMFEFFEGVIEKLGVKLIDNFSENLLDFIKKESKDKNNDKGGNSARIGSSGYSAQIGSSGDFAQIGSSGDLAQIGSSGYSAQIGSSGNSARIGNSGNSARIGSSGDFARIGSSGDLARIGNSGNSARIGSSGDLAQIGSSGDFARIGSSGDFAQIGSSGDLAQIGSSGYSAQIGSSGNSARIDIQGENSVGFACGCRSIVKGIKGTWISLCEYEIKDDEYIPVYALSAQIENKEYKDFRGRILKENEYYCLSDKKFYPVDISDGIKIKKISEKKKDNMIIIKGIDMSDNEEMYLVKDGELSAHGEDLREAIEDLTFKKMESEEIQNIAAEIKKTGKVNKAQYRAITGACQYGTNKFCEQHNITSEEIELSELRKILIDDYGAKKFWELVGE